MYCMKNADICNAFEFSNGACSISMASTFYKYSKPSIEKTIWYDQLVAKISSKTSIFLFKFLNNFFTFKVYGQRDV